MAVPISLEFSPGPFINPPGPWRPRSEATRLARISRQGMSTSCGIPRLTRLNCGRQASTASVRSMASRHALQFSTSYPASYRAQRGGPCRASASDADTLGSILRDVASGKVSPEDAATRVEAMRAADARGFAVGDFANLDLQRDRRTGFPEVVWGPGKTPEQIAAIMSAMASQQRLVMATRITPQVYTQLAELLPGVEYHAAARICTLAPRPRSTPAPTEECGNKGGDVEALGGEFSARGTAGTASAEADARAVSWPSSLSSSPSTPSPSSTPTLSSETTQAYPLRRAERDAWADKGGGRRVTIPGTICLIAAGTADFAVAEVSVA
eukprot:jgi/Mesvir1/6101/Mv00814-RA.2